jgi:DNA-binding transcriptional LysR family regulator
MSPRSFLRVNVVSYFSRMMLAPRIAKFLDRYPGSPGKKTPYRIACGLDRRDLLALRTLSIAPFTRCEGASIHRLCDRTFGCRSRVGSTEWVRLYFQRPTCSGPSHVSTISADRSHAVRVGSTSFSKHLYRPGDTHFRPMANRRYADGRRACRQTSPAFLRRA